MQVHTYVAILRMPTELRLIRAYYVNFFTAYTVADIAGLIAITSFKDKLDEALRAFLSGETSYIANTGQ